MPLNFKLSVTLHWHLPNLQFLFIHFSSSTWLLFTLSRWLHLLFLRKLTLPSFIIPSSLQSLTPHNPHNFKMVLSFLRFTSSSFISEDVSFISSQANPSNCDPSHPPSPPVALTTTQWNEVIRFSSLSSILDLAVVSSSLPLPWTYSSMLSGKAERAGEYSSLKLSPPSFYELI